MSYSKTKKIWKNEWYQDPHSNYAQLTNQAKHIETSKNLVDKYGPKMADCSSFCELGVGSGRNLHYFHEKYPQWTYTGNDINPNIHNDIRTIYPDLLNWAKIEVMDTLTYLRQENFHPDIVFTHGHLMHLPNDVIEEVCNLISAKCQKHILLHEAFLNGPEIGFIKRWKYRKYRFDRDYEGMFPGFAIDDKKIFPHPIKKGIHYCHYFFEKR
jgi:hypothetical protein